jgi:hypothetical protein
MTIWTQLGSELSDGTVNGVNHIGRFWHLICKLDRDVANFRPFCLTDGNPGENTNDIFTYHGFMA